MGIQETSEENHKKEFLISLSCRWEQEDDHLGKIYSFECMEDSKIDFSVASEYEQPEESMPKGILAAENLSEEDMPSSTPKKLFKCLTCNESFARKKYWKQHLAIHKKKKMLKCQSCSKTFHSKFFLKQHQYTHRENLLKCSSCSKSFCTQDLLKIHIRTHTGEKPFVCKYCDKAFSSKYHLATHIRQHIGGRPYNCQTCNKGFSTKARLDHHEGLHGGEKPYTSFTRISDLSNHYNKHENKANQCGEWGRKFIDQFKLSRHINAKHSQPKQSDVITSVVEIDGKASESSCVSQGDLLNAVDCNGMQQIELGALETDTYAVVPQFFYPPFLETPLQFVLPEAPSESLNVLSANDCGSQMTQIDPTSDFLNDITYHDTGGSYLLTQNLTTATESYSSEGLTQTYTHAQEKPFECEQCGRTFASKRSLGSHTKKTHNHKKKTFICHYCGKVFIENYHLVYHVTHVHSNQLCNGPFFGENGLQWS